MKKGVLLVIAIACLGIGSVFAQVPKGDVFKGKLFAPNVILEQRDALNLSKEQFTQIRSVVVEIQASVAEHEWDMREAYQAVMSELDQVPIDEATVLKHVSAALASENQVKKEQVAMLIKLKNLLTPDQVAYLEAFVAAK